MESCSVGGGSNGVVGSAANRRVVTASVVNNNNHTNGVGGNGGPDPGLFVVKKLLAEKLEDGVTYFKVRWKNSPRTKDTWEPEANLTCAADMIQEFRRMTKSACSGGGGGGTPVSNNRSSATNSSSRKRTASTKRWDVVPANELVASKTKFFDDLEAGKIDIRSNDLYSRVKCRRRAAGSDNPGSGGAGGDSEDALYSSDTEGGGSGLGGGRGGGGGSNHSDTGSCFAANSVGSSSTVEMDESRPEQIAPPTADATAGMASTAAVASAAAETADVKDANNSASSCDSGCPISPPKLQQRQQQQSSPPPPPPQSLLTDLLVSAKLTTSLVPDINAERVGIHDPLPRPQPQQHQQAASAAAHRPAEPADPARFVSNQVELLRAHVTGQLACMSPTAASRLAPLAWPSLCESVERGDWPAVRRTLQHHQQARGGLSDEELQRLLCLAVGRGHACLVDLLLSAAPEIRGGKELDVNFHGPHNNGATPLMLAVEQDSLTTVHRLLAAGADPDLTGSSDSNSPLQRAIRGRRPHLVDALCALGGADFSSETCEGQTPLRFARRICPQSAAVLEQYVSQLCRAMHDRVADHLNRLGFSPVALLFAPHYVRPWESACGAKDSAAASSWSTTFRLPPEEASHTGHTLALVHCRQLPRSLLLIGGRRQVTQPHFHHPYHHQHHPVQQPPVFTDEPLGLHCWLANGPCHVTSVLLNGLPQASLTPDGELFLAALTGAVPGENRLQLGFHSGQQQQFRSQDRSLRIGVFALRLSETNSSAAVRLASASGGQC